MNAGNNSPGLLPGVAAQIKRDSVLTEKIKINPAFKIASHAQKKQTKINSIKQQKNLQVVDINDIKIKFLKELYFICEFLIKSS